MSLSAPNLLLVSVGNSSVRAAIARADELQPSRRAIASDAEQVGQLVISLWEELASRDGSRATVIASVNPAAAAAAENALRAAGAGVLSLHPRGTPAAHRASASIEIPLAHTLPPPITVGQDRLLAALGAYARSASACVVIDAGTAITADFVDAQGVFRGGAIAPGISMMCRALHEHTAALPRVTLTTDPAPAPFGDTTETAIRAGVRAAAVGLTHHLIDAYAEFNSAYPRVIATGGDAPLLFEGDPLVEAIVPDLVLIGMLTACRWEESRPSSDRD